MVGDGSVTRDDIAAIERRIDSLERELLSRRGAAQTRCPRCERVVQDGRFCSACGAILHPTAPAPSAPVAYGAPAPAAPRPVAPAGPVAPASPAAPRPVAPASPAAPKEPMSIEKALGQRWAPRAGAVLVFLAVIFFLGVAIQRGWIGPLLQLALAALTGVALITAGEILTARRGYGTYPQVLQATGACVLYVTAFLASALPYYRRETNLTEIGSALLMAAVALGTVALALRHDARIIAGLGYSLAFLTAFLGVDVMPAVTLGYVALLATSLAVLVARKRWNLEAVAGSLSTGGLMLWLAWRAEDVGDPPAFAVAIAALLPAGAFLWLATRETKDGHDDVLVALLAFATFAWASVSTLAIADTTAQTGLALLLWALVALTHAVYTARVSGPRLTVGASGAAALILWLVGAPLAWNGSTQPELLTTMTYAAAALALAAFARGRERARGVALAALVLAGAAALFAIAVQGLLQPPWEPASEAIGPWQAWLTFVVIGAALAPLLFDARLDATARGAAFWLAAAFGAIWTFALFGAPLFATLWLVLLAASLVGLAAAPRERDAALGGYAIAAALAVLALVSLKVAFIDARIPQTRLDAPTAALQAVIVAATMLSIHALARARTLLPATADMPAAVALVGGSAIVLGNWALVYTDRAWPSILLGLLGVAYLAAGLIRRTLTVHRYTGFAALGAVLVRVFLIDLSGTDLAVRALVFAVIGAILLGVGYAYARMSKREEQTRAPPP